MSLTAMRLEFEKRTAELTRLAQALAEERQGLPQAREPIAPEPQRLESSPEQTPLMEPKAETPGDDEDDVSETAPAPPAPPELTPVPAPRADIEERRRQLDQEGAELEEQFFQLDEWRGRLIEEGQRLASQKLRLDDQEAQLLRTSVALDGQQAELSAACTELERRQQEQRAQAEHLQEQLVRQEETETLLARKAEEMRAREEKIEAEQSALAQQRQQLAERTAVLEASTRQVRQIEEKLSQDQKDVVRQAAELEEKTRRQLEARWREVELAAGALERRKAELTDAEAKQLGQAERIVHQRRALAEERLRFQEEQQQALKRQVPGRTTPDALTRKVEIGMHESSGGVS